jgi:spermidine synthase
MKAVEHRMPAGFVRRAFTLGLAASAFAPGVLARAAGSTLAPGLIERRESQYNTIYVVRQEDGLIGMVFGVNQSLFTESLYDPSDARALPVLYTQYMTVGLAYVPAFRSMLEIGLGGGRTAYYLHLHAPSARIVCVEIDPAVIALAQRHFGIRADRTFQVVERDGRIYLNQEQGRHDLILVDAYRGTFVPFHLLTREFFITAKRRLNPGGALVQNIEPTTMLYDAAIATLKAVFDNVDTYRAGGNIVAVAYDGERKSDAALRARAEAVQGQMRLRYRLSAMLAHRDEVGDVRGRVLTDDFAPVESLRAIERHNQRQ